MVKNFSFDGKGLRMCTAKREGVGTEKLEDVKHTPESGSNLMSWNKWKMLSSWK
jgi:hypothetical protein